MNDHEIFAELDAYAAAVNLEVSTVCRKATGNPRLRDRLQNRLERCSEDIRALRLFMKSNPPSEVSAEGKLCHTADVSADTPKDAA